MNRQLSLIKLRIAMVVLAGFFVITWIAFGMNVHTYFETLESLHFWQEKLEKDTVAENNGAAPKEYGYNLNPKTRVRRLEEQVDSVKEGFAAPILMFFVFGGLLYIGWRGDKKIRKYHIKND